MRLAVTLVALLAFAFQTFVVQTHIHGTPQVAGLTAPALEKIAGQDQKPDKFPPADDPANCPICQEMLHAGAFVAPAATALLVSSVATVIEMVVVEVAGVTQRPSHGWKSRAPPLA